MGLKEMFDVKTIKAFKLSAYLNFYTEETLPGSTAYVKHKCVFVPAVRKLL